MFVVSASDQRRALEPTRLQQKCQFAMARLVAPIILTAEVLPDKTDSRFMQNLTSSAARSVIAKPLDGKTLRPGDSRATGLIIQDAVFLRNSETVVSCRIAR
jgi:hypothetical protein